MILLGDQVYIGQVIVGETIYLKFTQHIWFKFKSVLFRQIFVEKRKFWNSSQWMGFGLEIRLFVGYSGKKIHFPNFFSICKFNWKSGLFWRFFPKNRHFCLPSMNLILLENKANFRKKQKIRNLNVILKIRLIFSPIYFALLEELTLLALRPKSKTSRGEYT